MTHKEYIEKIKSKVGALTEREHSIATEGYGVFQKELEAVTADVGTLAKELNNKIDERVKHHYEKSTERRWIKIMRNVASTQGWGYKVCIHVGSIVFQIFRTKGKTPIFRLEMFTPCRKFRIS